MLPIPRHILCYIDFHSTAHIYGYRASNDRLLKHTEKKKQFTRKMMLKNGWEKYHVKRKTTYNMLWNALQFEYKQRYMNNLLLFAHARSLSLICSLFVCRSHLVYASKRYTYILFYFGYFRYEFGFFMIFWTAAVGANNIYYCHSSPKVFWLAVFFFSFAPNSFW